MAIDFLKLLKALLLFFLVFAGLFFAKKFLIPLTIGAILALLFMPLCRWLEGRGVPKLIAAMLCIVIILLICAGIGAMLSWQLSELAKDAPQIKKQASDISAKITQFISSRFGISNAKQDEMLKEQQTGIASNVTGIIGTIGYTLVDCLLTLVYVTLILYYRGHLKNFVLRLAPSDKKGEVKDIMAQAAHVAQQYLTGLAKMIACLWILYAIGFTIAGVKNPLFFAFLCGLLEIVPFIGNLTGSLLTLLISVAQGAQIANIAGIVITYGFVQFFQGWVLEPIIVGPQVKINPLFTIIVLVVGEMVWGIPGMALAIPLTGMLKIVFDHVEPLKPYGFLIGAVEDGKTETGFTKKIKEWWTKLRNH
ncbi:MAG: AI-2E family transporter [Chitinophagales bacterium]|nr:AI-2E family transporter [Chitinophagales bacterium]